MRRAIMASTVGSMICAAAFGCGRDDGPQRYNLSGNISYEGEPIRGGWIVFAPESGPGATANIEDGKYATREGWGTVGGIHTIEVVALGGVALPDSKADGGMNAAGKTMFSYKFTKDIPKDTTNWDIEISRADIEQTNP